MVAAADEPTAAESVGAAAASEAYLDETARRLMVGARAARDAALSDIASYTAVVRERNSFEFSMLVRDRPILRRESATRVRWSRDEPRLCGCWDPAWKSAGSASSPAGPKGLPHALPPIRPAIPSACSSFPVWAPALTSRGSCLP